MKKAILKILTKLSIGLMASGVMVLADGVFVSAAPSSSSSGISTSTTSFADTAPASTTIATSTFKNSTSTTRVTTSSVTLAPAVSSTVQTAAPTSSNVSADQGIVTFSFDDGWGSQFTNAFPVLNAANLHATFYIISEEASEASLKPTSEMSVSQLLTLQAAGNEIGAHTRTHPHLTSLSIASATEEIVGSRTDLMNMGLSPVDTFAYPYGEFNSSIEQIVKNSGFIAACAVLSGFDKKTTDSFALVRETIVNSTPLSAIESLITTAMKNKEWLILSFHHIGLERNPVSSDIYSTTPANFQSLINFVKANHVQVLTVRDAFLRVSGGVASSTTAASPPLLTVSSTISVFASSTPPVATATISTVLDSSESVQTISNVVAVSAGSGGGGGGGGGGFFMQSYAPASAGYSLPVPLSLPIAAAPTSIQEQTSSNPALLNADSSIQLLDSLLAQLKDLEKKLVIIQVSEGGCPAPLTRDLSIGMSDSEIFALQKTLNESTITRVAYSGPGSPGRETFYFGKRTLDAVMTFETIFATDENGVVGPITRTKLNSLCGSV